MMHHGIQHLGGGDDDLAHLVRVLDQLLLDDRDLFKGDLDTQVASGDHDAVRRFEDLSHVPDALQALDLRDDLHLAAEAVKDLPDLPDIVRRAGKGSGDIIVAHPAAELDIGAVLLTDKRHGKIRVRDIHSLVVGHRSAVDDGTFDPVRADLLHLQFDKAVIDQDAASLLHVLRKILVINKSLFPVSFHLLRGQRKFLTLLQHYLAVLEISQTDLRTSGIQKCCYRKIQFPSDLHDSVEFCFVLFMCSVGKVKPRDIHTGLHQLFQHFLTLAGRSDGADDFCFSNHIFR